MLLVELLRYQRAKLDTIRDEEEQPIEQDDSVGIARAPMFNVLDVEDNEEGNDRNGGGPEAEIPGPDACEVFDLEGSLNGGRGD
jgi:hypothetical protein